MPGSMVRILRLILVVWAIPSLVPELPIAILLVISDRQYPLDGNAFHMLSGTSHLQYRQLLGL